MFWSSMFLTEMPMTSGCCGEIAFSIAASQVALDASANNRTSCPACSVAAATHAKPNGKGVSKATFTSLLDMSSTLTITPSTEAEQAFNKARNTRSCMPKLGMISETCRSLAVRMRQYRSVLVHEGRNVGVGRVSHWHWRRSGRAPEGVSFGKIASCRDPREQLPYLRYPRFRRALRAERIDPDRRVCCGELRRKSTFPLNDGPL